MHNFKYNNLNYAAEPEAPRVKTLDINKIRRPRFTRENYDFQKLELNSRHCEHSEAPRNDEKTQVARDGNKVQLETTWYWYLIVLIFLTPLVNSAFVSVFTLSKNISNNIQLNKEHRTLIEDKAKLNKKINEYHSFSGMKRTIKEEIKVIEKNEILLSIID